MSSFLMRNSFLQQMTLLVAFSVSIGSSESYAEAFYLTADKVVAPGHTPSVKLEAKNLRSVDVRVYHISDPQAYFDAQTDLHRPKTPNAKPRKSVLGLLKIGAKIGIKTLREKLKNKLSRNGRSLLKSTFKDEHQIAKSSPEYAQAPQVLPHLKEHALVASWRHSLPFKGGWQYDKIDIPIVEPGIYLVEAYSGEKVAHTLVVISDIALVTKQSADELLVWAVHPLTGAPQKSVRIDIKVRGKSFKDCNTDKDGLCRIKIKDISSYVLYATHEKSFTLIDPRFYSANLPQPRVYLFTERPVYKPNQKVFFKGFARDIEEEHFKLPKISDGELVNIEVQDPSGTLLTTLSQPFSTTGSFNGEFELGENPKQGMWQIIATVDEKKYAGSFKVMEFRKPEVKLKVRTDVDFARSGDLVKGDITAAYFFGAPYPSAEVKIRITKTRFHLPWYVDADYSWYYSEAEYQNTQRSLVKELKGTLDEKGVFSFEFKTEDDSADYTYIIEATCRGPTGKTITGRKKITLTKGAFRLSLNESTRIIEPGDSHTLKVLAASYDKNPIETEVEFRVKVSQKKNGTVETVEFLTRKVKTNASGEASIAFTPSTGGYYEVEVLAKDDHGVLIRDESFLFAAEDGRSLPFAPNDVQIVLDKRSYFAGDTATALILVPAPDAEVLFTVEGGALYDAKVIQAKNHAVIASIQITERQTPNFFVAATALVGGQLFAKKRSVVVPPREKLLTIEVSGKPVKAKPGEEVEFTAFVTDYKGNAVKNVELALGVVDEAIYSISPEIAAPLEGFFYSRKRNEVRTLDSLTFRFYGSARSLREQMAHRFGDGEFGFGAVKPQLGDSRKIMKDTAAWFPNLKTDAEGKARVKLRLPDNLTSWRATARGMTEDARVGIGKGNINASKDLMIRVALPPFLVEGDRGDGYFTVQNLSSSAQDIDVHFSAYGENGLLKLKSIEADLTSSELGVTGKRIVKAGVSERFAFKYEVVGNGFFKINANATSATLKDTLESQIFVDKWSSRTNVFSQGITSEQGNKHLFKIPTGMNLERASLKLSAFSSTRAAIREVIPYLVQYPYGCVEQTLSRFLPALAAKEIILSSNETQLLGGIDLDDVVLKGIQRLWQHQGSDGGWSWFGDDRADLWMTAYVLEGLGRSKELGHIVDDKKAQRAVQKLEHLLSQNRSAHEKAMATLALARFNHAPAALMARMLSDATAHKLDVGSMSWLAMAFDKKGDAESVSELAELILAKKSDDGGIHWEASFNGLQPHQHSVEQTSLAMMALAVAHKAPHLRRQAASWLMSNYRDGSFGSTRQTALAVRALQQNQEDAGKGKVKLELFAAGKSMGRLEASDENGVLEVAVPLTKSMVKKGLGTLVKQLSGEALHYSLELVGEQEVKRFKASQAGGLRVTRRIFELEQNSSGWKKGAEVGQANIGDALLVMLEINSSKNLSHVMIEDPRASGFTPIVDDSRVRISGIRLRAQGVRREHQKKRSVFFIKRLKRGKTQFYYLVRAGLPGNYRLLPTYSEAMYLSQAHHARSNSGEFLIQ